MFTVYGWPVQNYRTNPASANAWPVDVNSAAYQKRQDAQATLQGTPVKCNSSHDDCPLLGEDCGEQSVGHPLCEQSTAYVNAATGDITCFEDDDMVELGSVADGYSAGVFSHTPAVATVTCPKIIAATAVSKPQHGAAPQGSLPTGAATWWS